MKKQTVVLFVMGGMLALAIGFSVIINFYIQNDIYKQEMMLMKRYYDLRSSELDVGRATYGEIGQVIDPAKKPLSSKKATFLNIAAISFYYVNEEEITNHYNMNFREPTIENLIEKTINEKTDDIGTGVDVEAVLKSKMGGRNLRDFVRTIKLPETTVAEKFLRYQRFLLQENKVNYGFDEIEIQLELLDRFKDDIEALSKKYYDVPFSNELIEEKKNQIKDKLVKEALTQLEKINQYVLLSGKYVAVKDKNNNYRLIYDHPINEHLQQFPKVKVQITALLERELIQKSFQVQLQTMSEKSNKIPLKIFGKVLQPLDTNSDVWELIIVPFAIY
jgi:hypothetical protein